MSEIFNTILALGGAGAGIYGAIRAWLSNRKMKQIEEEKLSTKLNLDFNYEFSEYNGEKLCHGYIKWSNMGLTNIKLIKLNIDARNREDELHQSYIPPNGDLDSTFKPLSKQIEYLELVGINNHKFVNFSNDLKKNEIKIFKDDLVYGLELSSRQKRALKEEGLDVDIDPLAIEKNLSNYIDKRISKLKEISLIKDKNERLSELRQFLFYEVLIKDIRGLQFFPGESRSQEFLLRYKGIGMIYLNIETASVRLLLKSIDAIERYKVICDDIIDSERISDLTIKKFKKILEIVISPEAMEIHKQKSNYLIYLN